MKLSRYNEKHEREFIRFKRIKRFISIFLDRIY